MIRTRTVCVLAMMLASSLSVASTPAPAPVSIQEDIFAGQPRGPYQTGTYEEMWIDTHPETTTSDPNDRRRLMVQIWYPAVAKGNSPRARYALHRELYPNDEDAQWMTDAAALQTNSILKASLVPQPARFPVLLYNPGGGHPPFSATFQTEFLASHGYVVVAVGHTGLTRIERFPDGTAYKLDENDPELSEQESAGLSEVEQFRRSVERYAKRMMPLHVQDLGFVLDRLAAMNGERGNRFYQRLDLERVGSLGWSLGGALSLQASKDEPRIKAAANLDGWLYTDVQEAGTRRPIMVMHGGDPVAYSADQKAGDRELRLYAEMQPWKLYARTEADWYDVILARAEHGHFSDRTLFEPVDPKLMHPRLAHDIVNRITLEFFDKYLRQSTATPVLSGEQVYPEVTIISKASASRQ